MMWLIPLVPFGLGYLMAHQEPGADGAHCSLLSYQCAATIWSLLAGIAIWGPLICLAVLAINDVYDVEGDSANPRRATAPVANGRVSTRSAFVVAHVAGAAAVLLAASISSSLAFVTFLFLALGWLYSVPPARLKVRPGFDVAINALGNGGLAMLAGWTTVRSIDGFPWIMFILGCIAGAALYLPTTVLDYPSDLAANYSTIAVRLGTGVVYRIGLGFWMAAGIGGLVLAARAIILPQRAVWILAVSVPTLIGLYHWAFSRIREQREFLNRMGVVGFGSLLPLLLIALMYAGII